MRIPTTARGIGLIATSALLLAGCSTSEAEGDEPIVIAHVGDFSGDWSYYDQPIRDGLRLAAEEINDDGGILGQQVEILAIDTHGNQADAVRGVEEALDADAIYIVGTTDSGGWQAQASVACGEGVPISTGDGTSGTLVPSAGDCAHHVIMVNATQSAVAAEYALGEGYENAYVLSSTDDAYLTELPDNFVDAFEHGGGTIVANEQFRYGASDFNVQVTQIAGLSPQPDFIYTPMFSPDTPQFLRQLRAAGVDLPVISGDGSVDSSILVVGDAAEGLVATFHAWPSDDNDVQAFIENFEEGADASTSPQHIVSGLGYDELYMIKQVIEEQDEASPEALMEGFTNLTYEGVTGSLTMNPDTRQAAKEVAILRVEDGKYVFIDSFVPEYVPSL